MPAGNYTVNLTTVVDGNHTIATNQSSITVNPAPSTVSAENITVNVGDPIDIPVNSENATSITYQIIDKDGNVVDEGEIKPGESITNPGLPAGTYTVNLTANTDENHTSSSNTSSITVNKIPSTVIPTAEDIYVGDTETIDIKVGPEDATGTVNITVNGKTYTNVPLVNGTASIDVPGLKAGNYTVDVSYSGDDKYLPSNNTTTFEVKKILPPVDVVAPTITVGDDGVITVTVPKDATGTITIEVEGKKYTSPIKDGKAVFIIPGLKAGLHDIKAYYSGDDKYLPNNSTGTIEVLPIKEPSKDAEPVKSNLERYETGNPIVALLLVLALLGINIKRRK